MTADMLTFVSRFRMLCAALFLVVVSCAHASTSAAERARSIEGQVWSPYCPNRLLIDCTTPQARELRGRILERVERGQSNDAVLRWIRGDFGDEALARPLDSGAGLAIWLVPVAVFVAGAILVVGLVRRWTHRREQVPTAPTDSAAPAAQAERPDVRRIREEVERDL
jgi:cytochrome c-type biogenesis protein CcmH